MHKYFLRVTRRSMSALTTLHLNLLQAAVVVSDKRVDAAVKLTDVATVAAREANCWKADAQRDERDARKDAKNFRIAAQAEADSLRRGVALQGRY